MAPIVILIRHAQALHNLGEDQCKELREALKAKLAPGDSSNSSNSSTNQLDLQVERVIVSPMRRTLQTATLALDFLQAEGVPFVADAGWQETTDHPCDVGVAVDEIAAEFPGVDFSHVDPLFPDKTSDAARLYWYDRWHLVARAQKVLADLYARPEHVVAVVSHSGFLSKAVTGCMFGNADFRVFEFAEPQAATTTEGTPETEPTESKDKLPPLVHRLVEWNHTRPKGGMGWSFDTRREIGEGLP